MSKDSRTLIVFTRIPIPGCGKSRLSSLLSEDERCQLMEALLSTIIQTCTTFCDRVMIAYDGHPHDLPALKKLIPTASQVECFPQSPGNLGDRMYHAMQSAGPRTVLVGSDIADLSSSHLCQAFDQLEQDVDVVLAPTNDGGFGLVGMHQPRQIFTRMTWSHSKVCQQLCEHMDALRLSYALIDPLCDIDTQEDLVAYEVKSPPCSWVTVEHGAYIRLANNFVAYIPNRDSCLTIPEALGPHAKMVDTHLLPRPLAVTSLYDCPAHIRRLL